MMKTATVFAFLSALALGGCGVSVKFMLLEGTEWSSPPLEPISVYVAEERDLSGDYFERINSYKLRSVRDLVQEVLTRDRIPYITTERDRTSYRGSIENFLVVAEDSVSADIVVNIIVESFGYGDQTTMEDVTRTKKPPRSM
jgi:hypothetical protein